MKDLTSHFGFQTLPYTREISTRDHYSHADLDGAVEALVHTAGKRMSAGLLGPAGCGKTYVLRRVHGALPEARYRVRYVKVTGLSKRDMCREICMALGTEPAGNYPMLVRRVQEYLQSSLEIDGLRPVLLIDEAHDLRPDVLAMLRILTNFEMDSKLVVSVILAGQPPLRDLLQRADLECVARRLAHIATLGPLSKKDALAYLKHRCHVAGSRKVPFDTHATEAVFEIARGNMRATDRLALASLEVAYGDGSKAVDANHVAAARTRLWP
jgi:general secretion pathway protein A